MILSLFLLLTTFDPCGTLFSEISEVKTVKEAIVILAVDHKHVDPKELDHAVMILLKRMFGEKKNMVTTYSEQQELMKFLRRIGVKKE